VPPSLINHLGRHHPSHITWAHASPNLLTSRRHTLFNAFKPFLAMLFTRETHNCQIACLGSVQRCLQTERPGPCGCRIDISVHAGLSAGRTENSPQTPSLSRWKLNIYESNRVGGWTAISTCEGLYNGAHVHVGAQVHTRILHNRCNSTASQQSSSSVKDKRQQPKR
jgi:hypothetical protein